MDRLKRAADGFVPDWVSNIEVKYAIEFNNYAKEWDVATYRYTQSPGVVYFRTEKDAQNAIDVLGEELLK